MTGIVLRSRSGRCDYVPRNHLSASRLLPAGGDVTGKANRPVARRMRVSSVTRVGAAYLARPLLAIECQGGDLFHAQSLTYLPIFWVDTAPAKLLKFVD
jgi:hypothetical protein